MYYYTFILPNILAPFYLFGAALENFYFVSVVSQSSCLPHDFVKIIDIGLHYAFILEAGHMPSF